MLCAYGKFVMISLSTTEQCDISLGVIISGSVHYGLYYVSLSLDNGCETPYSYQVTKIWLAEYCRFNIRTSTTQHS